MSVRIVLLGYNLLQSSYVFLKENLQGVCSSTVVAAFQVPPNMSTIKNSTSTQTADISLPYPMFINVFYLLGTSRIQQDVKQ